MCWSVECGNLFNLAGFEFGRDIVIWYEDMGEVSEERTSVSIDDVDRRLREVQDETHRVSDIEGIKVSLTPRKVGADGSPQSFQLYFPSITKRTREHADIAIIDLPDDPIIHESVMDMLPLLAKAAEGDARKLRRLIVAQINLMKSEEN